MDNDLAHRFNCIGVQKRSKMEALPGYALMFSTFAGIGLSYGLWNKLFLEPRQMQNKFLDNANMRSYLLWDYKVRLARAKHELQLAKPTIPLQLARGTDSDAEIKH
eukprot:TRINITY_DN6724_c0_g1_i1.p1 TRINITY_DN6724_c0_g1~~TRINITY_DN6724_c0_g1_i1.p1  ORF type:complete len:106 (-),score=1.12 TRINITY_DN6724_c0_g1_i1:53-370(-)